MIKSKEILRKHSIRATNERVAFLDVLIQAKKPLTKKQIIKNIQNKNISISRSTIFRMFIQFIEKGIISEIHFSSEEILYEMTKHHHHHIKCNNCNIVIPVEHEKLEKIINRVQEEMFNKLHFKNIEHMLEFKGECKKCN